MWLEAVGRTRGKRGREKVTRSHERRNPPFRAERDRRSRDALQRHAPHVGAVLQLRVASLRVRRRRRRAHPGRRRRRVAARGGRGGAQRVRARVEHSEGEWDSANTQRRLHADKRRCSSCAVPPRLTSDGLLRTRGSS